jgi:hypothetical protein
MAIDYSGFAIPKSRVKALDVREQKAEIAKTDKQENAKAKQRAGGYCEVRVTMTIRDVEVLPQRCWRRDVHTHHLLGGIGRRNKGKSILALYKLRVCDICHRDIHAKVLVPTTAEHDATTVRYRRAR